jgi:hypothetical protein
MDPAALADDHDDHFEDADDATSPVVYFCSGQLDEIPVFLNPSILRVVLLEHNSLSGFEELAVCSSAVEISLDYNNIAVIPDEKFFAGLPALRILRLANNQIADWRSTLALQACTSLAYLTLFGNPFSRNAKYRPFIVNLCAGLMGLDGYATTDEELIESAKFDNKFR